MRRRLHNILRLQIHSSFRNIFTYNFQDFGHQGERNPLRKSYDNYDIIKHWLAVKEREGETKTCYFHLQAAHYLLAEK